MTERNEHHAFKADEIPCQEISDPAVLSKNPVVSVKMITYNHELYIAQAIEGVLTQETDFPIELVIGEDCSTDRTREIVLEYQRKHPEIIRVIISDKNVGMHKNGQRTQKVCRGKYVAFCEGDDYWHHPLKLQKQVDYLEAHPECGLVHSDITWHVVETGGRIPSYYNYNKWLHNCDNVMKGMIGFEYGVITCSAVVKRSMIEEIYRTCPFEFSEKFLMGDKPLWIEIAYRSKVKCIDEPLATHNVLLESASKSKDCNKLFLFNKSAMDISLHYAKKYGGSDFMELSRKAIKAHMRILLSLAYRGCMPNKGKEIRGLAQQYQVAFDPVSYFYFVCSQSRVASFFVRWVLQIRQAAMKTFRSGVT